MIASVIGNNVRYFDSFGVEHIPKEIKKLIGNKNTTRNIYLIQAYDSITCGHNCIAFIGFKMKGSGLLDNTKRMTK